MHRDRYCANWSCFREETSFNNLFAEMFVVELKIIVTGSIHLLSFGYCAVYKNSFLR